MKWDFIEGVVMHRVFMITLRQSSRDLDIVFSFLGEILKNHVWWRKNVKTMDLDSFVDDFRIRPRDIVWWFALNHFISAKV